MFPQRAEHRLDRRRLRETFLICLVVAGTLASTWSFGRMNGVWTTAFAPWSLVLYAKTAIEVLASAYAVFYLVVALHYRPPDAPPEQPAESGIGARTSVAYLCCDDLDPRALESIIRSCQGTGVSIVVHDDSSSLAARREVDRAVRYLEDRYGQRIRVLRRAERTGGKPGAVNNVVEHLAPETEFLLLCDSDSYFYDRFAVFQALAYFDDPSVALVQFRNVAHLERDESPEYRILAESVAFYDAFVSFIDRFGWSPFLGHNAALRVSTFREVGGFTPGQLADDIDYSVKLRLAGYRIVYARRLVAGERHPDTYGALRRRTHKWAYGCTQVLLEWGRQVLVSSRLSTGEKLTFFLTVGYYHFQVLLLGYLTIFYLLLPFKDPRMGGALNLFVSAGIILLLTFLPSISYFIRLKRLGDWPRTVISWAFVYGSQDFVMARAILQCLIGQTLEWIPTNLAPQQQGLRRFLPELLFGGLIVLVLAIQHPLLLLLPTTILFAGKFLAAPCFDSASFCSPAPAPTPETGTDAAPGIPSRTCSLVLPAENAASAGLVKKLYQ